jgi:alpha-galactosidase
MSKPSRRTFLKTGIASSAGLTLALAAVEKSSAATKSISGSFTILGLAGTARLDLESEVPDNSAFQITIENISVGKALARIRFNSGGNLVIRRFSVTIPIPLVDVQKIWYTQQLDGLGQHAYIGLPWGIEIPAAGHDGSLAAAVQNRHGRNRGFMALRNQTGDGSLGFQTQYGGKSLVLTINRFAKDGTFHTDGIDETVYLDREDIPWNRAVMGFVEWYDREWGLSYNTPASCFEPIWNTWYPSLGKLSDEFIELNARACRELGLKTFIIDDGWMKAGGNWEPKPDVFPDFRKTIDAIHAQGLRALIWYRPFIHDINSTDGKEFAQFRLVTKGAPSNLLCPRCREVQERAGRIAGNLMEKYGLDGLKIDFLDASQSSAPLIHCEAEHAHANDFVSDGVRESMRLMADSIRRAKPDAIIEYRLNYANIANRLYGNCYRGQDTPSDPDLGRRHLSLIRSWCRGVAPQSDPAFWSPLESDENVARYLATIMFYAVPTLSINFADLPVSHVSLIRAWLAFYNEHMVRFRMGQFDHLSDDPSCSIARISYGGWTYIPAFLRDWPSVIAINPPDSSTIVLFNGTSLPSVLTRIEGAEGAYRMVAIDIMHKSKGKGALIKSRSGALNLDFPVDIGGMVTLKREG